MARHFGAHDVSKMQCFLKARLLQEFAGMTKTITLLIAFGLVAGSIAFLRRPVSHASERSSFSDVTCGDQYNDFVLKAKQSLQRGDRAAAVSSLIQAQDQLRHCEELEERNAKAPRSVVLNSFQLLAFADLR
jgi:hypothetical protein